MNTIGITRLGKTNAHLCTARAMMKALESGDRKTYGITEETRAEIADINSHVELAIEKLDTLVLGK